MYLKSGIRQFDHMENFFPNGYFVPGINESSSYQELDQMFWALTVSLI